ncbi:MAG: sugar phosphate nucleotidyltransferase, partial [Bacteroidales bacterium]|nr:sugar phosphate nucleotidyltransferase [Bacteroidales bacterium]
TISAVKPGGRFGALAINESNFVTSFREKPKGDGTWINGGFFVCEPEIFDFIKGDDTIWEREPLEKISSIKQLVAFKHEGFWQPMDTLRDKRELENMWNNNNAPWKVWNK